MTPDVAAKIAALEARLQQQETEANALRYEHECVKAELSALRTRHDTLMNDHCLLVDDFFEAREKIFGYLEGHRDEIKELAVLAGNSANALFPKLDDAWQEIDRILGLTPKTTR